MNLLGALLAIIILGFGLYASYQDIKERKVSNWLVLALLIVALGFSIYVLDSFTILTWIVFLAAIILGFLLYKKDVWGAADGKIFISLSLLILAYQGSTLFGHFLVNIVMLYSVVIVILTQIFTSSKQKQKTLLKIDYIEKTFMLLIVFLVIVSLGAIFDPQTQFTTLSVLTIIFILFMVFADKYIKRWYNKQAQPMRITFLAIFGALFLIIGVELAILYFVIVLLIKLGIVYVSELTEFMGSKKKKYHTPFAVFLFLAALVTVLFSTSLVALFI